MDSRRRQESNLWPLGTEPTGPTTQPPQGPILIPKFSASIDSLTPIVPRSGFSNRVIVWKEVLLYFFLSFWESEIWRRGFLLHHDRRSQWRRETRNFWIKYFVTFFDRFGWPTRKWKNRSWETWRKFEFCLAGSAAVEGGFYSLEAVGSTLLDAIFCTCSFRVRAKLATHTGNSLVC